MIVLGIETTCDETACGVVVDGKKILANTIASQADLHALYGGVFPEMACRKHMENFIPCLQKCLNEACIEINQINLIAVAQGPGLAGALMLGLSAAKSLAYAYKLPLVGVNHVEAHLYAAMMIPSYIPLPALGVVVSGGHTFLVKILAIGSYEMIGRSVDDAIGEAFDKVAVMLGLPYPGGPNIEKLASLGDPSKYHFTAGKVKNNRWDFSFSGLKTNVLYTIKGQNSSLSAPSQIAEAEKPHIAAAFQETALADIAIKSANAAQHFNCKAIFLGGGVSNNSRLRTLMAKHCDAIPIFWPPPGLCLDNGAMIAGLGYHRFLQKGSLENPLNLEAIPRMRMATHII